MPTLTLGAQSVGVTSLSEVFSGRVGSAASTFMSKGADVDFQTTFSFTAFESLAEPPSTWPVGGSGDS